jgi:uncharacterized protein YggE
MTMRATKKIRIGSLLALIAYPASAIAQVAPTVEPLIPAAGAILDVTAEGRTTRVPDIATIRAGVVAQGTTSRRPMSRSRRNIAMARTCPR